MSDENISQLEQVIETVTIVEYKDLLARAEILVNALRFYANKVNHEMGWRVDIEKYVPANSEGTSEIESDQGELAQQALCQWDEKNV